MRAVADSVHDGACVRTGAAAVRWVLRLHDARDPLLLLVSERLKMGAGCCGMLGRTGRGVVGTLIAAASGDDHAARRIALRASGCVCGGSSARPVVTNSACSHVSSTYQLNNGPDEAGDRSSRRTSIWRGLYGGGGQHRWQWSVEQS